MKKNLLVGILACCICLLVYSCVEKNDFLSNPIQSDSELLEKAKAFYEDRYQTRNLRTNGDGKNHKKLEPSWNVSHKSKLENGETILVVETTQFEVTIEGTEFYRCYVFKEQEGEIVDARIVEFIGNATFLRNAKAEAVTKSRSKKMKNYTGLAISYDLDYQYLDGYSYKNGERENTGVRLWVYTKGEKNDLRRSTSTLRTQVETEYCEKIYWCYAWTNGAITNCVYTGNCDVNYEIPPPPPGGGIGTPTTAPSPTSVKNELKTRCLRNVFNNLKTVSFENKVQNILSKFNKSATLAFTITEAAMSNTNTNATTVGKVITLNTTALANASQEYIARVIYHEVLHVFLGSSENLDHARMSRDYVAPLAEALIFSFAMNPTDANALAWISLKDRPAFNALSEATKLSYFGIGDRYKNLNNGWNHAYGLSCP